MKLHRWLYARPEIIQGQQCTRVRLGEQGDLDGAHTLHSRSLSIREARLSADHPSHHPSRESLAEVRRSLGVAS
jgi:hypothetical protein